MKPMLSIVALVCALAPSYAQTISDAQIHVVLGCAKHESPSLGVPFPDFKSGEVLYDYHIGQFEFKLPNGAKTSAGSEDELRLAVYGPNKMSVTIYDVFLELSNGKLLVRMAHPAVFTRRSSVWTGHDNPNGIATDFYLRALLKEFSSRPASKVSISELTGERNLESCKP